MFKDDGIYTIGRMVVLQDTKLAQQRPDLAIKTREGGFWYSGRAAWNRYWVDPASPEVAKYNIEIAKKGIDAGLDEIQFDYIRFPSDGDMNDIVYPVWDGKTPKYEVMRNLFSRLKSELKAYKQDIVLSIDVFGHVYSQGQELSVGQRLEDIAEFFDVVSPMAYPSHYRCGEFNIPDPNYEPFKIYDLTLAAGLTKLDSIKKWPITRPWIQDFSIRNIYNCGLPAAQYDAGMVRNEISAIQKHNVNGFMLWNAASTFTEKALLPK